MNKIFLYLLVLVPIAIIEKNRYAIGKTFFSEMQSKVKELGFNL